MNILIVKNIAREQGNDLMLLINLFVGFNVQQWAAMALRNHCPDDGVYTVDALYLETVLVISFLDIGGRP